MVLFITTVHTDYKIVIRPRRRPPKTAINPRIYRKPFRDKAVKELSIP